MLQLYAQVTLCTLLIELPVRLSNILGRRHCTIPLADNSADGNLSKVNALVGISLVHGVNQVKLCRFARGQRKVVGVGVSVQPARGSEEGSVLGAVFGGVEQVWNRPL